MDPCHLTVVRPFGAHSSGELIIDPDLVARLLDTHAEHVVRIQPLHASPASTSQES